MTLGDRLTCRGYVVCTLFQPRVEVLEWLLLFVGFLEVDIIGYEVCCLYVGIVAIYMAYESDGLFIGLINTICLINNVP